MKDILTEMRRDAESEYTNIFETTEKMAEVAGTTMAIPRRCGRQNRRNNVAGDTPEVYFRRVLFAPFLDDLLQQLESRFDAMSVKALIGLKLLPRNVGSLSDEELVDLEERFGEDLPRISACRSSDLEEEMGMHRLPTSKTLLQQPLASCIPTFTESSTCC